MIIMVLVQRKLKLRNTKTKTKNQYQIDRFANECSMSRILEETNKFS